MQLYIPLCQLVRRSVGQRLLIWHIKEHLCITAPAQMFGHHYPCPPARDFSSCASGLVFGHLATLFVTTCVKMFSADCNASTGKWLYPSQTKKCCEALSGQKRVSPR